MATQYWITGTSGDWSTALDWQSGVVPSSTDDAVISNSNAVTVDHIAVANSLILNSSIFTVSGSLTLKTSLTFGSNSDELILSGGTLSAQSIASPIAYSGYIYGYGTINAALTGDIVVYATSGTLNLQGPIADDLAALVVNPDATLRLAGGSSSPVYFEGPAGTLSLDVPSAFTGSIHAYAGNAIDLIGVSVSSATYSGTTLTINETNGQTLTYTVSGSISGDPSIANDGAGGTNIYWPLTVHWNSADAGDWSVWANWTPEIVPISIDDVVIDNSNAVTVNGTAVAHSLSMDHSTLTLNGGTLSAQSITSGTYAIISGYGTINGAVSGGVEFDANGGILKLQGSLAGDNSPFFYIYSGSTLELGTSASVAVAFLGKPATLKLDAPTTFTGSIQQLVIGDTIDLAGITASSATYSGTTLTINETNGQQLTYNNVSGSVAGDIVSVASDNNGGTVVSWTPPPDTWITGTSGDWSQATDWSLGVVPTSTTDAVINNSNAVTVNGTAVAHSLTLNNSELVVSGTLTLGTSLTLESGTQQAELALNGGSFSAQSIMSNNGEGVLAGYGTINGAVSGYVLIYATGGGTLKVEGPLAGDTGYCFVTSHATLELVNGTSQLVQFGGGTLKLDTPTAFTGQIKSITIGDTIDLVGITASSANYSGTTLTVNETNGQQLIYNNVSGSLAGDFVTTASDNDGGTLVYWTTAPLATTQYWITGTAGDWSTSVDWQSGVLPKSTDDAVINNSYAVTVNGAAVAHSLTLNNSYLTVTGSLAVGTSLKLDGITSNLVLTGGSVSAQSIVSDAGSEGEIYGYGTISGVVSGLIVIGAEGGTLKIESSVLADTTSDFGIHDGATLEFSNGISKDVAFSAGNTTLKLDVPATFTGQIKFIDLGATIDLVGITASTATYNGATLTVYETNGQNLTYSVSGSVAGDTLTLASDSNGGTEIFWSTLPAPVVAITSSGGYTNHPAQTISGTVDLADAGSLVTILDGNAVLGTTLVQSNGTWTDTIALTGGGTHTLTALDTGVAGGISVSNAIVFTLGTIPPAVTESLFNDTGSSSTDKITYNDELTGSGDPNVVVHFTVDGNSIASTTTANASGAWTFTSPGLADGSHTIVASETDSFGNTGTASLTFTLDTTPPAVAITSSGGLTTHPALAVSGTVDVADAGTLVTLHDGTTAIGTATVQSNGSWSDTITLTGNGTHTLTAQDTDAAGNTGTSNAVTYTLIASAPSAYADLYLTTASTPLTVAAASGVLANDADPNGLALSATLDQTTAHGMLVLNQNGSLTYTPQVGFVGTDSFTYTAYDTASSSTVTTASIVVGGLNALTSPSQLLTELYVGYFDRAPDVSGLNYWLSSYNTPPAQSPGGVNPFYQNLGQAAASFADPHQTETVTLYPFLADPQAATYSAVVTFVDSAYGNLFNRTPDTLGEEYWATSIAKSLGIAVPMFNNPVIDNDLPVSASQALLALINGAQNSDGQTIANKVTAGLYYYNELAANNVTATQASAHAALAGVTYDPATVLTSEAITNAFVRSVAPSSAASVSLVGLAGTSALDHAVGSA